MTRSIARPRLDATGIFLSTLCMVHCLVTPIIATGALAWIASETIHVGLTVILSGVVVLSAWPAYRRHGRTSVPVFMTTGLLLLIGAVVGEEAVGEAGETMLTIAGSISLVIGHILNIRCCRIH